MAYLPSTTCPITSNLQVVKIPRNQMLYQRANACFSFSGIAIRRNRASPEGFRWAFGGLSSRQGRQMNIGHGW